ncbi:MAG: hypothetical protein CMK59_06640 [Proteobacteria bacterium]|nr:hypothetical protein [Pseudomonadota bacterium]
MKQINRRNVVGIVLGIPFILIGINHFSQPEIFNAIVPSYLGWPYFWNYTSGAMEIIFGAGMMFFLTRKHAARLLFILVILMSLANLNMWINDIPFNGIRMSTTAHIVRWIIQFVLLAVLLWLGEIDRLSPSASEES